MSARFVVRVRTLSLSLLLVAVPAMAASSTMWEISTGERLAAGTLEGTALDPEGRVRLAPDASTLWGPDEGIVWELDGDGAGGVLVALSNPSRMLRVGAGTVETWFVSNRDGALITSLVADGQGGAYFGLAPDGRVIHAADSTSSRPVIDTDSAFVWSLALDAGGALWVGTGLPGRLLRWNGSGEPEQLLDTGDDPVRSIVAGRTGGVVIGTGGRGRVIRIDASGEAFVMHDADESEIVDLVMRDDGTVFALAASSGVQLSPPGKQPERAVDATIRVTASAPNGEPSTDPSASSKGATAQSGSPSKDRRMRVAPGASLYRIDPDGHVAKIWRSARYAPFSMAASGDGVVIGTGDDGRLIVVDARGRAGRLLQLASHQVSALRRLGDGSLVAGATSDARVVRLGNGTRRDGSYTTAPIDAGRSAAWGRIAWEAEQPRGSAIEVRLRGGNTSEPDETWTAWLDVRDGTAPDELPATRWLQLRFDVRASRGGASPAISAVRVYYRPRNRPPAVDSIEIHPPGVVWIRPPVPPNANLGPQVADDLVARRIADTLARPGRSPTVRKAYEVGVRTVSWIADDADGDRMLYDLDLRREGETTWIPLARDVDDLFLSWDARAVDDARYRIRVRARDDGDNPEGEQLDDVRVSELFLVDTAPPSIGTPALSRDGTSWVLRFEARDAIGEVAAAELSLDGGPWRPVRAADGVADSARERFEARVTVPSGSPAPSLRVRVADAAGNLSGAAWSLAD